MLKILQARLQQYMNRELSDSQARFRKGRGTRNQTSSIKKAKGFQKKHLFLLYWLCQSLWLCRSQQTGKFFKRCEYQTTLPVSWEICTQVKNQTRNNRLVPNWERSTSRLYIVTQLQHTLMYICRVHHVKCQRAWNTSWNQDCWEKYQ